jgi:DNA-binding GntR family transcriptional regulator
MAPTDTRRAYEVLREKIVTTEMPPGSLIHEATLMGETGFGRTPIREALKMLEAERLVTVSPRRGMFVTTINISDLAHIQEIRSALDPLCVRLAVARITQQELVQLRALVQEIQAKAESRDMQALIGLDRRFHRLLAESTRNPILVAEDEMLYNLSLRIWHYYLQRLTVDDFGFDELSEIVDALAVAVAIYTPSLFSKQQD